MTLSSPRSAFLCLALGGAAALVTWALYIFAEDYDETKSPKPKPVKSKKKGSVAASSSSSKHELETAGAVDSAAMASASQAGALSKEKRSDYIPDGCCKPEPASPTVIENPGAQNLSPKRKPRLPTKSPQEDEVVITLDTSFSSKKPDETTTATQLDTAVHTMEEQQPVSMTMMEQEEAMPQLSATISQSSFTTATMTPPKKAAAQDSGVKELHWPELSSREMMEVETESGSHKVSSVQGTEGKEQDPVNTEYKQYVQRTISQPGDYIDSGDESLDSEVRNKKRGKSTELLAHAVCEEDIDVESVEQAQALQAHDTEIRSASTGAESVEFSRTQHTETEEMIETEVEETVTMVIVGVVANPGAEEENIVSMQEAVTQGILDLSNGLYYNSTTKEQISMVEAMNTGLIKMGQKKFEKSQQRVKSVGIITIRTTRETIPYTVKAAKDTTIEKLLDLQAAISAGILDPEHGTFTDKKSGNKMLIGDAVDLGLVEIEYDMSATGTVQEEVLKTYSVHAVVDQRQKTKLPFHEAVNLGLIDQATGEYVNNVTGDVIPVEEAISRGFIKATLTDNPASISVGDMGSRTAERGVDAIRKKVLNPLKALRGMKK